MYIYIYNFGNFTIYSENVGNFMPFVCQVPWTEAVLSLRNIEILTVDSSIEPWIIY